MPKMQLAVSYSRHSADPWRQYRASSRGSASRSLGVGFERVGCGRMPARVQGNTAEPPCGGPLAAIAAGRASGACGERRVRRRGRGSDATAIPARWGRAVDKRAGSFISSAGTHKMLASA